MYFTDHNPPHFHVKYKKYEASIRIKDFKILKGDLPKKVYDLVIEWAELHKNELMNDWTKAKNMQTPDKIKPLV